MGAEGAGYLSDALKVNKTLKSLKCAATLSHVYLCVCVQRLSKASSAADALDKCKHNLAITTHLSIVRFLLIFSASDR